MLHSEQVLAVRPGNRQEENRVVHRLDVVFDRSGKSEQASRLQVVRMALGAVAYAAVQHLNRTRAIDVVLLHPGTWLH